MADVARAVRRATVERRAVVLMLPLDVQAAECDPELPPPLPALAPPRPGSVDALAELLAQAERPAIIAGRGAVLAGAGPALRRLGELTGAVLATSAVANGLFAGDPYAVGIAGGFSSPVAARLLGEADVVVAFGAALNQWTTRHGTLIAPACPRGPGRPATPTPSARTGRSTSACRRRASHRRGARRRARGERIRRAGPRRSRERDRRGRVAARPIRGRSRRGPARPAHAHARARRHAAARAHRGRRLRPLHGLAVDVPARSGRRGLRLPAGLPVRRARARERDRRRAGAARPADRRGARRRRRADGAARARDARPPEAEPDGAHLRRRGLRRRGPPLPADGPGGRPRAVPRHRLRGARRGGRLPRAGGAERAGPRRVRDWLEDPDRPLVVDARVDPDICADWLEEAFRGH